MNSRWNRRATVRFVLYVTTLFECTRLLACMKPPAPRWGSERTPESGVGKARPESSSMFAEGGAVDAGGAQSSWYCGDLPGLSQTDSLRVVKAETGLSDDELAKCGCVDVPMRGVVHLACCPRGTSLRRAECPSHRVPMLVRDHIYDFGGNCYAAWGAKFEGASVLLADTEADVALARSCGCMTDGLSPMACCPPGHSWVDVLKECPP
jgi:hypothetical protein